jgi:hypothetical protein
MSIGVISRDESGFVQEISAAFSPSGLNAIKWSLDTQIFPDESAFTEVALTDKISPKPLLPIGTSPAGQLSTHLGAGVSTSGVHPDVFTIPWQPAPETT